MGSRHSPDTPEILRARPLSQACSPTGLSSRSMARTSQVCLSRPSWRCSTMRSLIQWRLLSLNLKESGVQDKFTSSGSGSGDNFSVKSDDVGMTDFKVEKASLPITVVYQR